MFPSLAKKIGFPLDALIDKYEAENKITPAEKSIAKNYAVYCLDNSHDLWIAPFVHIKQVLAFQMWAKEKHKVVKSQGGRFLKWCVSQEIFRVLPNAQKFIPLAHAFLQDFLKDYDFNVRTRTRETYQNVLVQYEKFSQQQHGTLVFNANCVKDFKNYLIEKGTSPFTINNYISCLKTLSNWAIISAEKLQISTENIQELTHIGKIKSEKIDHSQYYKDSLTEDETFLLLDSITDIFDKTLFATMLLGGLRTIEVRRLLVKDIDLKEQKMWLMRKGKNIKKPYPMTQMLASYLDVFLEKYHTLKPTELLFGVTYSYIWKMFRHYTQTIGLWEENMPLRLSPHSCRHTAIQWVKNKLGIEDAQQFAGHASITSTMPYAQKTIQEQFADKIKNL